jgi:hypothetical protein
VRALLQREGYSEKARQKRQWRVRERNRRGPDMRRSSIYGWGEDVMMLDRDHVRIDGSGTDNYLSSRMGLPH